MVINNIDAIRAEVRRRREERGWSQRTLAEKAGVGCNTPFLLEKSQNDIYLGTLLKILETLDMKLEVVEISHPPKRQFFRY